MNASDVTVLMRMCVCICGVGVYLQCSEREILSFRELWWWFQDNINKTLRKGALCWLFTDGVSFHPSPSKRCMRYHIQFMDYVLCAVESDSVQSLFVMCFKALCSKIYIINASHFLLWTYAGILIDCPALWLHYSVSNTVEMESVWLIQNAGCRRAVV